MTSTSNFAVTRDSSPWPSYPDLAGKVAVVTGGSRGLGAAACRALAANEVKVVVNGRDGSAIDATLSEIGDAGGTAIAAPADCTNAAALVHIRDQVEQQLGPVDVLLAFAGGGRQPEPVAEIAEYEWRADVDRNLTATFLTVRTFLPAMIARRAGSIITMASVAARLPGGAPIAYAAAKAGIIVFSQQVAKEAGPSQVRVNCLCPSTVLTERMRQAIPAEQQQQMAKMYPLGRLGVPDDVANASLFLASDASSWITGVTLDIRRTGHGVTLGEAQSPSSARLLKGKSLRFRAASTRSTEPARRAHLVAAGCDRPPSTVVGCRDGERR